jgi:hypothetical protein
MASYKSFGDRNTLVEILAPNDEISGIQGQTARNITEKYIQMSNSFPELIRLLKKRERTETDQNVTQAIVHVRIRAENLLDG